MTPGQFLAAVHAAGVPEELSRADLDRRVADLLQIDERTARRYRRGEIPVPGPARVALACLACRRAAI